MRRDKKLLNRRQWLRPASSWGPQTSIHSDMSVQTWGSKKTLLTEISGGFGLRDCSNYTSLDFSAVSDRQYALQLKAIDKLLDEVQRVRNAWVTARVEVKKRGGWKCT